MITTPGQLRRRAELYHQLGSMIAAGVPLIQALQMTAKNPAVGGLRKIIPVLIGHLQEGLTFSDSMVRIHGWLPEFDVALLSVGEQSGRLDNSFKLLAGYYATRAQIIRDTIAGSIVTIATLHVFFLVFPLNLWIAFGLGIYNAHYAQCVPFLIEKAVVFGVIYGTALFLIFASQGNRGGKWRAIVESLLSLVPILRVARKHLVLSRLSGALEALISGGVSVVKSWKMAVAAAGSPRLANHVSTWPPELERGATPADLVNRTPYFPEMFANLYTTGEQSGKLDETLARLQEFYQEEGFRTLRMFTRIMNGTIYGLVVLLVAYNVIKFYVGYFNAAMNSF
ncbi:MAG TPA: type II secretion system F family protein [Verrucomicrobiae bacterium]|nr:type II secretion system F family protein [Verrucomicrobiae bacterium]